MKACALLLVLVSLTCLGASQWGISSAEIELPGPTITTAPRIYGSQVITHNRVYPLSPPQRDSHSTDVIIPARGQFGLYFNGLQNEASLYSSLGNYSHNLLQALDKAPQWLRADLQNTLLQLTEAKRELYAELINQTNDPLIDEVAFAIAHSSPQYLNSSFASPELFTENAAYIYSIDQNLAYVEVLDIGNSLSDPNYYSTTRYKRLDNQGNLQLVTVPYEIYYWYIVHPKLTDEIAAYINPAIVENNSTHNNNIAPAPSGVFWRSWLYTVQEDDYPVLADTLNQCQTLFNRDGSSGDAIRAMQWWINQTMSFNSNSERPHQPVRIYRKHMGRCGEYQDYTAAVARLGLIPCTGILSVSTDHVWNEFWETDWVQWEPVNGYIDNPLVYENGWGKVFGSVFECRSDGYFSSVTERYSEGLAQIRIRVVDQSNNPVDGARVLLAIFETTPRIDMIGFTDNDGWVVFPVGENRDYRARCETSWGIYPAIAGTYAALTSQSVSGETYDYLFTIDQIMPRANFSTIPVPDDPIVDYQMAISYHSPAYYLAGRVTWDDIASLGSYPNFMYRIAGSGEASGITVDSDNLLFLQYDLMASIFESGMPAYYGTHSFSIPVGTGDWYSLLDNSHSNANAVLVSANLNWQDAVDNDDEQLTPVITAELSLFPNPIVSFGRVVLNLPNETVAELSIYNLRGQKVRSLCSAQLTRGTHEFSWDGRNQEGANLASGVYYLQFKGSGRLVSKRFVILGN